jgi:hypothetical protein
MLCTERWADVLVLEERAVPLVMDWTSRRQSLIIALCWIVTFALLRKHSK